MNEHVSSSDSIIDKLIDENINFQFPIQAAILRKYLFSRDLGGFGSRKFKMRKKHGKIFVLFLFIIFFQSLIVVTGLKIWDFHLCLTCLSFATWICFSRIISGRKKWSDEIKFYRKLSSIELYSWDCQLNLELTRKWNCLKKRAQIYNSKNFLEN